MSTAAPLQNTAAKSPFVSKSSHAGLLLQRKCACGNSASSSLSGECGECDKKRLQKKLSIGASNDPLEQEADRVAEQVLAAPAHTAVSISPPRIQRSAGQATGDAGTAPASVDRVLSGSGRPLDPAIQQDMGQRFGHDFSQVRVHTGAAADQSTRDVYAHAYTVGHNIVFGAGRFAPETPEGRRLVAHELTHVVQQSGSAGFHPEQGIAQHGLSANTPTRMQRQPDPSAPSDTQLRPSTFFLRSMGRLVIDGFPTGQSTLTDDQRSSIHTHASTLLTLLQMDEGGQVYVTGHGDAPGSQARNLEIGRERAEAVRDELVTAGVPIASIEVDSAGETEPVNPGAGADPANRRAVIDFSPMLRVPGFERTLPPSMQLVPPLRAPLGAGSGAPRRGTALDLGHLPPEILDPGSRSGPRRPTLRPDIFRPVPPPPAPSRDGLRQFFESDSLLRALPDFLRSAAIDGLMSAPNAIAGQIAEQLPAGETRDAVEGILRALAGYMTGKTWSPPPSRDPRFDMPPAMSFPSSPGQVIIPGPTIRF